MYNTISINILLFCDVSGVSSFNQLIHELSVDSDGSSSLDYSSEEEEYSDDNVCPATPLSQSSRLSRASSFTKHKRRHWLHWIRCIFSWLLFPLRFLLAIPFYLYGSSKRTSSVSGELQPSHVHATRRLNTPRDHVVQRATDRRRGVVEVMIYLLLFFSWEYFVIASLCMFFFFWGTFQGNEY